MMRQHSAGNLPRSGRMKRPLIVYRRLSRPVLMGILIPILLVLLLELLFRQGDFGPHLAGIAPLSPSPVATGAFYVQGNKIYSPDGTPFLVKGVTAIYGRFAGGDAQGIGLSNYRHARRDLDLLKQMRVNFVRIIVSADYAALPPDNPNYVAEYMQELDNVVQWSTMRGMVVEVANAQTRTFATGLQFVKQLAERYKNNPYVWLEPMNEPNCSPDTGNEAKCQDWGYWQQQQVRYIQAIRNAGMNSPIIVNTIGWSWDLSQVGSYPLHDNNIIYGAHRYPNPATHFTFNAADQASCDTMWANLAAQFPIIVDEVGAENNRQTYLAWDQKFIDYVAAWVNTREGAGAVAFVYYWSDGNSMTEDSQHGVRNQWGNIFYDHYLTKVG